MFYVTFSRYSHLGVEISHVRIVYDRCEEIYVDDDDHSDDDYSDDAYHHHHSIASYLDSEPAAVPISDRDDGFWNPPGRRRDSAH